MMRLFLLMLFLCIGCGPKNSPELIPVNNIENFQFIEGSEMNLLNSWRQENFDKHIVTFDYVDNGFVIYWIENPGDSRQVFIWEPNSNDTVWHVEHLKKIKEKYINQEILDICYTRNPRSGFIVLLKDKLEPYKPSTD